MRDHAIGLNLRCIAMPKITCSLDGMDWREMYSLIEQTFKNSGITIDTKITIQAKMILVNFRD